MAGAAGDAPRSRRTHATGAARAATSSRRLTIDEASRRIAAGELSPVELTRAYLERIERVDTQDQRLHHRDSRSKRSSRRARSTTSSRAGQSRGPLHGIPLALKDNIDTAGVLTTAASAVYADRVPQRGRRVRAQAARRRRRVPRQAQHARVRLRRHVGGHALRPRAQPVESRLTPRRLVGRLGGRRRRAAVRRRARHGHGGVGALSGCVLRRRRGSKRRTDLRAFAASCRCRRCTITWGRSRAASRTARSS